MANSISVAFLNINGLSCKRHELKQWLSESDMDILCLAETKARSDIRLFIPGFTTYAFNIPEMCNGMMLFHKTALDLSITSAKSSEYHDIIKLKVRLDTRVDLHVTFMYRSPKAGHISMDLVREAFCHPYSLLMGDLNCNSPDIYPKSKTRPNHSGALLSEFLNSDQDDHHNPCLLNDVDVPTFYEYNQGPYCNMLDLGIASQKLCSLITDFTVGDEIESDHRPICCNINCRPDRLITRDMAFHNFAKADWEGFTLALEAATQQVAHLSHFNASSPDDIDSAVESLSSCIRSSMAATIPKFEAKDFSTLPADIILVIKSRRRLRKLFQATRIDSLRVEANRLSNRIKSEIRCFRKRQWDGFCSSVCDYPRNTGDFWKLTKVIGGISKPSSISTLSSADGEKCFSETDKAELFASSLQVRMRHVQSTEAEFAQQVKELVDNNPAFLPTTEKENVIFDEMNTIFEAPISVSKLEMIISGSSNAAPGPDSIPIPVLKRLPASTLVILAAIFNSCFSTGYFPDAWKVASVVMLPKPGKPRHLASSYRPISLTSCMGKLFEKCINCRLVAFLEKTGALGDNQCAYRAHHSTDDHLVRLCHSISEALGLRQVCVAVMLDVEAAFDSVWHDGLRFRMSQLGLCSKITRLLSSYLRDRSISVRVGKSLSRSFVPSAGAPQGGVLAPILFIMFMSSMPAPSSPST